MNAAGEQLKILSVEDSIDDLRLICRALQRGGREIEPMRVETEAELRSALAANDYDLIITAHGLPDLDSADVLMIVAELAPAVPCMLVSGKVGEEVVGHAMRLGAGEYVAKDNLELLPGAVERLLAVSERRRARDAGEQALARSGRFFEAVFVNARDSMLILDDDNRIVGANPAAATMFALSRDDLLDLRIEDLTPDTPRASGTRSWDELREFEERRGEVELLRGDGTLVATEYAATAEFLPGRHMIVLRDIRERRAAEAQALRHIAQQETIAELGESAVRGADTIDRLMHETITRVADTLGAQTACILRLEADEGVFVVQASEGVRGMHPGDRIPTGAPTVSISSYTAMRHGSVVVDDFDLETRFGRPKLPGAPVRSAACVEIPGGDAPFGVLTCASTQPAAFDAEDATFLTAVAHLLADALQRARAEEEMRWRALHDPLTALANRTLLFDRLSQGLARAGRLGTCTAVMCLDIDHFKTLNDTFGHRAGDQLLIQVGARVQKLIRASDTVARFGGDEFVIVYDDVTGAADAEALAARVLEALRAPFDFDEGRHQMSASIGIAISDADHLDADTLLRDADVALYRSKERGRSTWTVATEEMRLGVIERSRTKRELARAIDGEELFLAYQPIVALDGGAMTGVEALVRWQDPLRGVIPPARFIPIAEETGLIFRLGEWVLREACEQAARWRVEFGDAAPLPIQVNVSAQQIASADLSEIVRGILSESGVPPEDLVLEITESALPEDLGDPLEILGELRGMGVGIVLDDFGTGYSSLSHLDRFPIDKLKIDRSFVDPLVDPNAPAPIVTAIVGMAKALGVSTVAEGVETVEQVAAVAALGCDFAQGYFFARPGPAEGISELVRDGAPLCEKAAAATGLSVATPSFGRVGSPIPPGSPRSRNIDDHRRSFLATLLTGNASAANNVVYTALADQIPADTIDARIIGPAMVDIGSLWDRDEVSIGEERIASGIAAQAAALAADAHGPLSRGPIPPITGQTVLLANAFGESHLLGLRMAADMLLSLGMGARYCGGPMPSAALIETAAKGQPDFIGLTITRPQLAERVGDQVDALRAACPRAVIFLGGQGVSAELLDRTGAAFVPDVEALVNNWPPREPTRSIPVALPAAPGVSRPAS